MKKFAFNVDLTSLQIDFGRNFGKQENRKTIKILLTQPVVFL